MVGVAPLVSTVPKFKIAAQNMLASLRSRRAKYD